MTVYGMQNQSHRQQSFSFWQKIHSLYKALYMMLEKERYIFSKNRKLFKHWKQAVIIKGHFMVQGIIWILMFNPVHLDCITGYYLFNIPLHSDEQLLLDTGLPTDWPWLHQSRRVIHKGPRESLSQVLLFLIVSTSFSSNPN